MLRAGVVSLLCVCVTVACAQVPAGAAFQVASIHVHAPDQGGKVGFYSSAGGVVECGMCTVTAMVALALDVDSQLVTGAPAWSEKTYFDVKAVPPDDSPSRKGGLPGYTVTPTAEQRAMLLQLLTDRFGLRYHMTMKEMPVYFLERGAGPLRLEAAKYPERAGDPRGGLVMGGELVTGEGFGESVTMDAVARQLMWPLERPVLNRTGIAGVYDFHVGPVDAENRDKVRGALLMVQALGLKLTAGGACACGGGGWGGFAFEELRGGGWFDGTQARWFVPCICEAVSSYQWPPEVHG